MLDFQGYKKCRSHEKGIFLEFENLVLIFCLGLHRKILVIESTSHPSRTNLVLNSTKDGLLSYKTWNFIWIYAS